MFQTILVESQPASTESLCKLISVHFHEVHLIACCRSAEKAMDFIRRYHPDLVVANTRMDGRDDFGILDACVGMPHDLVAIVHGTTRDKTLSYGPAATLSEPVRTDALARALEAVRQKRLRELALRRAVPDGITKKD